jgi:hypothetical protein
MHVKIKGENAEDDGLSVDVGVLQPGQAWWTVPLPPCPDCGGDVVWYEAGYAPGTRKCMGMPIGGRPTNPVLDSRVPKPGDKGFPVEPGVGPTAFECARKLYAERNICADARVEEIDREIIRLLYPWTKLEYDREGGCGSMFQVNTQDGRVVLRRDQFY